MSNKNEQTPDSDTNTSESETSEFDIDENDSDDMTLKKEESDSDDMEYNFVNLSKEEEDKAIKDFEEKKNKIENAFHVSIQKIIHAGRKDVIGQNVLPPSKKTETNPSTRPFYGQTMKFDSTMYNYMLQRVYTKDVEERVPKTGYTHTRKGLFAKRNIANREFLGFLAGNVIRTARNYEVDYAAKSVAPYLPDLIPLGESFDTEYTGNYAYFVDISQSDHLWKHARKVKSLGRRKFQERNVTLDQIDDHVAAYMWSHKNPFVWMHYDAKKRAEKIDEEESTTQQAPNGVSHSTTEPVTLSSNERIQPFITDVDWKSVCSTMEYNIQTQLSPNEENEFINAPMGAQGRIILESTRVDQVTTRKVKLRDGKEDFRAPILFGFFAARAIKKDEEIIIEPDEAAEFDYEAENNAVGDGETEDDEEELETQGEFGYWAAIEMAWIKFYLQQKKEWLAPVRALKAKYENIKDFVNIINASTSFPNDDGEDGSLKKTRFFKLDPDSGSLNFNNAVDLVIKLRFLQLMNFSLQDEPYLQLILERFKDINNNLIFTETTKFRIPTSGEIVINTKRVNPEYTSPVLVDSEFSLSEVKKPLNKIREFEAKRRDELTNYNNRYFGNREIDRTQLTAEEAETWHLTEDLNNLGSVDEKLLVDRDSMERDEDLLHGVKYGISEDEKKKISTSREAKVDGDEGNGFKYDINMEEFSSDNSANGDGSSGDEDSDEEAAVVLKFQLEKNSRMHPLLEDVFLNKYEEHLKNDEWNEDSYKNFILHQFQTEAEVLAPLNRKSIIEVVNVFRVMDAVMKERYNDITDGDRKDYFEKACEIGKNIEQRFKEFQMVDAEYQNAVNDLNAANVELRLAEADYNDAKDQDEVDISTNTIKAYRSEVRDLENRVQEITGSRDVFLKDLQYIRNPKDFFDYAQKVEKAKIQKNILNFSPAANAESSPYLEKYNLENDMIGPFTWRDSQNLFSNERMVLANKKRGLTKTEMRAYKKFEVHEKVRNKFAKHRITEDEAEAFLFMITKILDPNVNYKEHLIDDFLEIYSTITRALYYNVHVAARSIVRESLKKNKPENSAIDGKLRLQYYDTQKDVNLREQYFLFKNLYAKAVSTFELIKKDVELGQVWIEDETIDYFVKNILPYAKLKEEELNAIEGGMLTEEDEAEQKEREEKTGETTEKKIETLYDHDQRIQGVRSGRAFFGRKTEGLSSDEDESEGQSIEHETTSASSERKRSALEDPQAGIKRRKTGSSIYLAYVQAVMDFQNSLAKLRI